MKRFSQEQEAQIAKAYEGRVSPSSGARSNDPGDVSFSGHLVECKLTGDPATDKKSFSIKIDDLEKIHDEAHALGRTPMMAIRIYNNDSLLSGNKGYVDLVVRLLADDVDIVKGE